MNKLRRVLFGSLALCSTGVAACSTGADIHEKAVGTASLALDNTCASGGPCTLNFTVPQGLTTQDVVLSSTTSLTVGTGASVKDGAGGYGLVANFGLPVTLIGDNANVGSVTSVAAVNLGTSSVVHGSVKSGGVVFFGAGATVTGTSSTFQTITPDATVGTVITFSAAGAPISVVPGVPQTLAPGSYGDVNVPAGGTLGLSSGSYQLASLTVQAGATLQLDESNGPVRAYIHNAFNFAGTQTQIGGDGKALFAVFGQGIMTLSAPFHGTVNAPNSLLTLSSATGSFVGSFFADSILVTPGTVVTKGPALTGIKQDPSNASLPPAAAQPPFHGAGDLPVFLQWAYGTRPSQGKALHSAVQAVAGNESIGSALVSILQTDQDLGNNLVQISILGDLRTQAGFAYLKSLLATPLPTTGTMQAETGDMPVEAVELAKRQSRAVDAVSLMLTTQADATLLQVISSPQTDITVQARAVHDFIFRHGPSARATLSALLPASRKIFLDQIDVVANGASYDSRLSAYLSLHPEVVPPPVH